MIFRTDGCSLEGCVRETEISLRTGSAAVWAGGTRKALETREKLGRNEKRRAADISTPGAKSLSAKILTEFETRSELFRVDVSELPKQSS
ncbi:hypothetical protein SH501x_004726 [Pirellulaceae bacterium SH501]